MEYWDILDENGNKTGQLHRRGDPMPQGVYHLVVHVWIMNSKGEFLLSKRSPEKDAPLLWEATGGSAVAGDDSLTAALREVREELGISLDPSKGERIRSGLRQGYYWVDWCDVWFFRHDCDISTITLQPGETCDAKWATIDEIERMVEDETFVPTFDYLQLIRQHMRKWVL